MDEPFTAAEAAIPGPQHPQAEPEAATPSTASQAQPSVPLGLRNPFAPSVPHQTVFAVTLSNAKSNTPDDEINADRSHQDVSYDHHCHANTLINAFTSLQVSVNIVSEYLTLA
jgi:hypothetical protein